MGRIQQMVDGLVQKVQAQQGAGEGSSGGFASGFAKIGTIAQPVASSAAQPGAAAPITQADIPNYAARIGFRPLNGMNIMSRGVAAMMNRGFAEEDKAYQESLKKTEGMRAYDKVFGTHTAEAYPEDPAIKRSELFKSRFGQTEDQQNVGTLTGIDKLKNIAPLFGRTETIFKKDKES